MHPFRVFTMQSYRLRHFWANGASFLGRFIYRFLDKAQMERLIKNISFMKAAMLLNNNKVGGFRRCLCLVSSKQNIFVHFSLIVRHFCEKTESLSTRFLIFVRTGINPLFQELWRFIYLRWETCTGSLKAVLFFSFCFLRLFVYFDISNWWTG